MKAFAPRATNIQCNSPPIMDVKWDRDCPTFPLELFANIIDHQDRDALAISSLVCTSWRSFAQPRLFSRLQFDERRIKMFIDDPDIVDSPLSTIRDLVKVVVIYDRLPFEHAEIVQLLSSFKKVTELSYGNPFRIYNRMDEKTAHDLAETFHSITAVTLFATFRTFQQMITFICAFPFLVKVNMKAEIMTGYQYPSYPHINCQPSPTLRALKLHCRLYEIIPWLLQLNPIPQITELTLKDFLGANFIYIGKLLSTLGPSLKRLTLVETTRCPYAMLPFHGKRFNQWLLAYNQIPNWSTSNFHA
ncbi:hypothetical protein BYT27DRAFT_6489272 [Phlegmacium glaucopus]|nr:hypothetical protein BYT27DRAFT_6489272 [Phlegmacium glaucopus]